MSAEDYSESPIALFADLYPLNLRESASIHCHLRLTNSLFLTADEGK